MREMNDVLKRWTSVTNASALAISICVVWFDWWATPTQSMPSTRITVIKTWNEGREWVKRYPMGTCGYSKLTLVTCQQTSFEFSIAADLNDCGLILYSLSLVLLLNFQKYLREKAKVTPPTIHTVVSSVKLHWHLGIFNSILRLTPHKLNTLSLLSAATANSKMVYLDIRYFFVLRFCPFVEQ